ncbi:hypothetical protein [Cupriavidus sp. CP313]
MYDRFIAQWRHAFAAAAGWPAGVDMQDAATTTQAITYGLISRACISDGAEVDLARVRTQVRLAVHGYLRELHRQCGAEPA